MPPKTAMKEVAKWLQVSTEAGYFAEPELKQHAA
jgi:hypothetical protein